MMYDDGMLKGMHASDSFLPQDPVNLLRSSINWVLTLLLRLAYSNHFSQQCINTNLFFTSV